MAMRRCFFLAVGVFMFLLGAQSLAVERFVLKARLPPVQEKAPNPWTAAPEPKPGPRREMNPPDWVPWTLMSTGAVVALYACTVARGGGK